MIMIRYNVTFINIKNMNNRIYFYNIDGNRIKFIIIK